MDWRSKVEQNPQRKYCDGETLAKCSSANSAKSSCSSIHKTTAKKKKKKKKSISNTKTAAAAAIISNEQENFNHVSKGKRLLKGNTDHMDIDRKVKGQQKKKSVANTEKANLFNQTIISNGESVTQKLNHISRGYKSPPRGNTYRNSQQVTCAVSSLIQMCFKYLETIDL